MGKFFEAMQRAAKTASQPAEVLNRSSEQPELDAALLEPEVSQEVTVGAAAISPPAENKGTAESPSAVIRLLESEVHRAGSLAVSDPQSPLNVAEATASTSHHAPRGERPRVVPTEFAMQSPTSTQPKPFLRDPDPSGVRVHPAYDRIVQRLLSYRRTPRQSVILVSSAVPGEGTSTIARNVATALSQPGTEQVLLVDANLRTPSQHSVFGVEREKGLSEVLKGEMTLTSVLHSGIGNGISFITSGGPVKSPTQLLTAAGVQGVMMALLSLFDWIIVDSPPVTAYPDAASLAAASGAVILVIRAESTRSEVIDEAKNILENTGVELLGAVLNRRRFHIPSAIYKWL